MFYRMLRRERGLAQAGLLRIRAATRENAPSDETNFVFTRISGIRTDIWAVRVKGDAFHKVDPKPVRLTAGPLGFSSPQPSPDRKKIYVVGNQPRSELVRDNRSVGEFTSYLGGLSVWST
jgi:hypothetical protein